ncbi:MAG TPA: DUF6263 family protein [Pirellulaceae bacterium]|nr:DUF6263 family protein [Pirellulaceae bacterium]
MKSAEASVTKSTGQTAGAASLAKARFNSARLWSPPFALLIAALATGMWLSTAAGVARADEPVTLRWKLVAGQKFVVSYNQKVDTETSFGGKPLKLAIDSTIEQDWQVEAVDAEGVATISQSVRRVALRMDLPPASAIEFDTSSPKKPTGDAQQIASAVTPLLGAKLTARLSARGQWSDVTLSPELKQTLQTLAEKSILRDLLSQEGLEELARHGLATLPEAPIKVNDSWDATSELKSSVGKVKQTTTYKYEGTQAVDGRTLHKLASKGVVDWSDAPRTPATNRQIKEQKVTGTALFDAVAGRFVESELLQQLRTEARVRDTLLEVRLLNSLKVKVTAVGT